MKRLLAALACTLAGALPAFPASACTDPGGIGGTGINAGGGIGGTGQSAEAEVGLLGVITGFASICVNGIEVHYDAGTPVSLNGEPVGANALALGQVVAVNASGSGTQARARAIHIIDSAVGPLTAVEVAGRTLRVLGQRVVLEPSTVLGGGLTHERLASLQVGEPMRVSGFRSADGSIVATRIEAAPARAAARAAEPPDLGTGRFVVQGYVSDVQAGEVRVGNMAFRVPPEIGAQLARDRLVRVSGTTEGRSRVVERADLLSGPFNIRPERTFRIEPRQIREDRSGRSGPGPRERRPERIERPDRSGPSDRPERLDRSGRH